MARLTDDADYDAGETSENASPGLVVAVFISLTKTGVGPERHSEPPKPLNGDLDNAEPETPGPPICGATSCLRRTQSEPEHADMRSVITASGPFQQGRLPATDHFAQTANRSTQFCYSDHYQQPQLHHLTNLQHQQAAQNRQNLAVRTPQSPISSAPMLPGLVASLAGGTQVYMTPPRPHPSGYATELDQSITTGYDGVTDCTSQYLATSKSLSREQYLAVNRYD
ncbi:unnamed protein product [Protopolystoma xenopodis]|uniref:Uncharacterized protein n=1 Tax=Protopolystoma xenopodis TaxID=117903 RepID=A0A3S5AMW0_9PLAT|nr:unnamed protein product [Protopolystoma xenopodis]